MKKKVFTKKCSLLKVFKEPSSNVTSNFKTVSQVEFGVFNLFIILIEISDRKISRNWNAGSYQAKTLHLYQIRNVIFYDTLGIRQLPLGNLTQGVTCYRRPLEG